MILLQETVILDIIEGVIYQEEVLEEASMEEASMKMEEEWELMLVDHL